MPSPEGQQTNGNAAQTQGERQNLRRTDRYTPTVRSVSGGDTPSGTVSNADTMRRYLKEARQERAQ